METRIKTPVGNPGFTIWETSVRLLAISMASDMLFHYCRRWWRNCEATSVWSFLMA